MNRRQFVKIYEIKNVHNKFNRKLNIKKIKMN